FLKLSYAGAVALCRRILELLLGDSVRAKPSLSDSIRAKISLLVCWSHHTGAFICLLMLACHRMLEPHLVSSHIGDGDSIRVKISSL
ncbi:13509_t:CDS:2, partial [Gigaspora rosea]